MSTRRIVVVELEDGQEYAFSSGILAFDIYLRPGSKVDFTETGIGKPGNTIVDLESSFSSIASVPLLSEPDFPMKVKAKYGKVVVFVYTAN